MPSENFETHEVDVEGDKYKISETFLKERDSVVVENTNFETQYGLEIVPAWDSTDHMHFMCAQCKSTTKIESVRLGSTQGFPTIHIYAVCPNCEKKGKRKIYIGKGGSAAMATFYPLRLYAGDLYGCVKGSKFEKVKEMEAGNGGED